MAVFALSYDSVEALEHFANRKRITYPLLSDPDSEVIKRFGLLNEEVSPEDDGYGIPHPGTFVVDRDGIVRSKYFEKDYRERQSFYSVASQEFGAVSGTRKSSISTPQLKISTSASQDTVVAANRLTLAVEINLSPKMHVYAPEVEDYRPLELQIEPSAAFRVHPTVFPQAEVLYLAAIDERVPVYETEVRLLTDITLAGSRELKKYVTSGDPVAVEGILRFQACDDRVCFPPQEVPLRWVLNVVAFDEERVPGEFRHKSKNQE